MKIGYLILAHTDPLQLRRLVRALGGGGARFFVHIDKKVDMRPFVAANEEEEHVQFVESRIRVTWGGFSQVEAALALMRMGLGARANCDYFVLLTGLDYPIKSRGYIEEYLETHPGREFIRCVSMRDVPYMQWRISMALFNEHAIVNKALNKASWFRGSRAIRDLFLRGRRLPEGLEAYCGSMGWALTQNCVRHIIALVERNRRLVDFFRHTYAPDELFFHTIVMNSEYASKVNQRVEYENWLMGPVKLLGDEIKFCGRSANGRLKTVLDEQDFYALERSECLFARKLTSAKSLKLIERIDKYLLASDPHPSWITVEPGVSRER